MCLPRHPAVAYLCFVRAAYETTLGRTSTNQRGPSCGREEYGGERDILLLPCELVSLDHRKAFLWTPTTAARDRRDPWVVEIVADVNLRAHFGLQDADVVEIRVPT